MCCLCNEEDPHTRESSSVSVSASVSESVLQLCSLIYSPWRSMKQPNCGVFKARSLPLSLLMHICIRDERDFDYFDKH